MVRMLFSASPEICKRRTQVEIPIPDKKKKKADSWKEAAHNSYVFVVCEGEWDVDNAFCSLLIYILFYAAAVSQFPPIGIIKLSSNPFYLDG